MHTCSHCEELSNALAKTLEQLTSLTSAQLEAFRSNNMDEFARLDKELENTVGAKERRFGAFREHQAQHTK
jgi:Tfp pilus assembly protein PilN